MCHLLAHPLVEVPEALRGYGLEKPGNYIGGCRGCWRRQCWYPGCSGVLFESKEKSGATDSIKVDSGEGWDSYDTHPRYPYDKKNSNDEMSIMLKTVKNF